MYNFKIWFNIITILKAENITFASIITGNMQKYSSQRKKKIYT